MSAVPSMSEEERARRLERLEAAGFRPSETCECAEPEPGFGGTNGAYIVGFCWSCRRRLREEEQAR